jgi:SPP1 family predicted phage head-tail adaptor
MTGVFDTGELVNERQDVADSLETTCQIQRTTDTSDGAGGQTAGSPSTVATVGCTYHERDLSREERELAGRLGVSVLYTFTLPYDANATTRDRLIADGRTFEVAAIAKGSLLTSQSVIAAEVS